MSLFKILSVLLVLTVSASSVLAIKCFQCNSVKEPECKNLNVNDTDSPFFKECTGNYEQHEPFCRKITQTIVDEVQQIRVLRSCGWLIADGKPRESVCKTDNTDFILKKNCQCYSEGCNSSNRIHFNLGLLLSIVFIGFNQWI